MLDKIKPSAKLYMLVLVLGSVIAGVGVYGISKMKSMSRNTQTMYIDRMLPLQQLTTLRYAYANGILSTAEELKSHNITSDEAEKKILEAEKNIAENWTAYNLTYFTPEEAVLVKQTELLKAKADKAISRIKQNLKKPNRLAFSKKDDEQIYASINPLLINMNALIQLQIQVSSELNESNSEAYRSVKNKFLVLIAVALLFASALSFIILKDVRSLIANLRESNKKIAASEEKYRTLIENAADAVFMINEEALITDVNEYGCRLLGYSRDELLHMKISDVVPPEERERQGSYLKLIRKNRSALTERRLRRKDGSEVEVEINSQILDGKGHVAIVRDITERKRAEEAVKRSEERFRLILENMPILLNAFDEEGNIIVWNNACEETTGYTADEMMSNPKAMELLYPNPEYLDMVMKGSANPENKNNAYELRAKDGKVKTIEWFDIFHHINIPGWATWGLGLDITPRKLAEETLQKSEEKHRALVENIADGIAMADDKRVVFYQSPSATRIHGYSFEERKTYTPDEFIHDDDKVAYNDFLNLVYETPGVSMQTGCRMKHKEGHIIWTEGSMINLLHDESVKAVIANFRDVTGRKKAEEENRKSEQNYSSLFEQASDVIVLTDLEGNILEVNKSGCELLCYTREEMIGRNISDFVNPEELKTDPIAIPQVQEGAHIIRRGKVLKKNGEIVELENNSKRIFGNRILLIGRDITELRKAELQIAASEERHRALTENISDAIMLIDENFENVYQSPSVERITGYSIEDVKDKKVFEFTHPDDLSIAIGFFRKSYASQGIPMQNQFRIKHKNGNYIWIEGTVMNLLGNEGIRAFIVNYRDITERKLAEERQRQSDQRYKSIITVSNTGAWEYHSDNECLWCSPEYFSMLGRNRFDFDLTGDKNLQETWIDLLHPDDKENASNHFAEYLRNGSIGTYENYFRMKHSDGSWVWIWSRGQTLRDAEGNLTNLTVGTHIDITERKKAEEEINSLNESLEQKVIDRTSQLLEANKALEAFSYSVTHDLKAPLRSVIEFTKIIQEEHSNLFNNDLMELFGYIRNSTKRMSTIIDDLLSLAKYEKANLQPAQVKMNDLFKDVWDTLQFSSPHHAKLQIDQLPEALGDASLIQQVVVNLLSNAVKYSSKKENPLVTVNFEKGDGVITYRIRDNGAGFDMKNYDRLFGAFQRLHGMSEFEGTGVGLLLVKRIVERHGGVVWAESKVNEGATFYFTLPSSN